eukprot:m.45492 g.45492  ORF g.45492 m.45492 type:complete len:300 (-) comp14673_c0_seq1:105-1004(-)
MTSHRQNQMRKGVWIACLLVTTILAWVAYYSEKWVEGDSTHIGIVKQCVGGSCSTVSLSEAGHWAWEFSIVVFGMVLGLCILATLGAVLTLFIMRDRVVHATRVFTFLASLLMFAAFIIWPIGLDNKRLPCSQAIEPEAYHLCHPWDVGIGMYIMIISMVFLTFAVCLGSLITSKVSQRKEMDHNRRMSRKQSTGWYGQPSSYGLDEDEPEKKSSPSKPKQPQRTPSKSSLLSRGGRKASTPTTVATISEEGEVQQAPPVDDTEDYLQIESRLPGWSEPGDVSTSFLNPMFDDSDGLYQ